MAFKSKSAVEERQSDHNKSRVRRRRVHFGPTKGSHLASSEAARDLFLSRGELDWSRLSSLLYGVLGGVLDLHAGDADLDIELEGDLDLEREGEGEGEFSNHFQPKNLKSSLVAYSTFHRLPSILKLSIFFQAYSASAALHKQLPQYPETKPLDGKTRCEQQINTATAKDKVCSVS